MLADNSLLLLFRGTERLFIAAAALTCIVFGYRLFRRLIETPASAELTGASFTVKLINVGPGVFFALFGSAVLGLLVWQQARIGGDPPAPLPGSGAPPAAGSIAFGVGKMTGLSSAEIRLRSLAAIAGVEQVSLSPSIPESVRPDLVRAVEGLAPVRRALVDEIFADRLAGASAKFLADKALKAAGTLSQPLLNPTDYLEIERVWNGEALP